MCSVLEEDFMIEEKPSDTNSQPQVCKKCQTPEASVVLRKKDYYCKDCFLAATTHKFRAMLGKYRIIKPNDKILVVYRLGQPSTTLLHMIRAGLDQNQHKKLRFEAEYLFIDDLEDVSIEKRNSLLQKIDDQIKLFKFTAHFTSLQQFIFESTSEVFNFEEYIHTITDINKTICGTEKKLTSKQEFIEISKKNLTTEIAKKLDCKVVITPEISIDTTVGILTNVALGRGSQISLNVGIIDDRDPEIKFFTPLRLFEIEELQYYNDFYNLNVLNFEEAESSPYESVQNLMKKFVEDLQVNYPSTIKTVTRTGDKLTYKKSDNICTMCKAPIDTLEGLTTNKAVDFSTIVSKNCIEDLSQFEDKNSIENYCYACSKLKNEYFFINQNVLGF